MPKDGKGCGHPYNMKIECRVWIREKERKDGKVMREGRDNWPVHMYFQIHIN